MGFYSQTVSCLDQLKTSAAWFKLFKLMGLMSLDPDYWSNRHNEDHYQLII